jgi:hypothetical protein
MAKASELRAGVFSRNLEEMNDGPLPLEQAIDEAEWSWLEPHAKRGSLILIHPEIKLLEAARKIALDDKDAVQKWIKERKLTKPDQSQIDLWSKTPTKKFMCVVVEPFVVAQEILLN